MKTYFFYASKTAAVLYGGGWSETEAQEDTVANCGVLKGDLYKCDKATGKRVEDEGDVVYAEAMTAAMNFVQRSN